MSRKLDQHRMDKIRAARGLPPQTRENLMDRTRAAVCFVNTGTSEATKLNAFLAIFHPDMPDDQRRELINSKRNPGS